MGQVRTRITSAVGATIVAAGLFAGAGMAAAETPSGGHSQCPQGYGGYNCQTKTGIGKQEKDCYENGAKGGVLGVFGGPQGVTGGTAAGCLAGVLGWF